MQIICAWCNKEQGSKDSIHEVPTHGICDTCREEQMKQLENMRKKHASFVDKRRTV